MRSLAARPLRRTRIDAPVAELRKTAAPAAPVACGQKLNFYGIAVAPEIRCIREAADEIVRRYQDRVPGSKAAVEYLLALARECRTLIRRLLVAPAAGDGCTIEFVAGTSRAVEIALARTGRPATIVVSPFEHPSVVEVVRWFAAAAGSEVCRIRFAPRDFSRPWREQEDELVAQVASATRDGTTALILSEVCYATGVVLPVARIIDRLAAATDGARLRVVLDGAHAAGNAHPPRGIGKGTAYVFSAHKWLLAPEPCGVVVTPQTPDRVPTAYDAWSATLPTTTANVHMIAGLASSLRLLDRLGLENLWAYSRQLRERFVERSRSRFVVVGEGSGLEPTLLLAVSPRPPHRWRFRARELSDYLERNSVHALVMAIDPQVPWVRVAFPCFLDLRQVDVLCEVLAKALA